MPCNPAETDPLDFTHNLTSFSASYSMYSDYSASVNLENPICEYYINTSESCVPVEARIDAVAVGLTDQINKTSLDACYEQSPKWVNGLVTSFGESQDLTSDKVDLSIGSFFDRLNKKPIVTYRFASGLQSTMNQLLTYFAGIPSDLYDVDLNDNFVFASIDGGSIMDAIKLVAQAGQSTAFVQVGGILEIAPWKDHTSPADLILPPGLVGPLSKRAGNLIPALSVLARGAEVDTWGCGQKTVTDARTTNNSGGYASVPGNNTVKAMSGLDTKTVKGKANNVAAKKDDLKNAQVIQDGDLNLKIDKVDDGAVGLNIKPDDPAGVIDKIGKSGKMAIQAAVKDKERLEKTNWKQNRATNQQIGRVRQDQLQMQKRVADALTPEGQPKQFPNSVLGGMAGGPDTKAQSMAGSLVFGSDQSDRTRLEAHAYNASISGVCGTSFEQIDNPLISTRNDLFRLAVRRHQEILLDANTFNVTVPYIPCLRLNQVVRFDSPGTRDCPPRAFKGLVTAINVNYNAADAKATMDLSIADLDVLGQTEYTSSNLLDFQCGGGEGADTWSPWIMSAIGIDAQANVEDRVVTIFGQDGHVGTIYAYANQRGMVFGGDYTLSFNYQALFGSSPLIFNNTGGSGATLLGPVGTYTENFFGTVPTIQFQWSITNPISRTMWRITNIQLRRTVTA
jgi:hypothetical protein